jgi:hypothetical protein
VTTARWLLTLTAIAAGCSGGSEKPGALLHGPGALALFNGIVAHDSGSLRPYLAIANERGDDLRLLDTTDNHIVTSPGLVFPLSVPSSGRPLFVAATRWADGAPDALVVIGAGSNVVELVDTWSGYPTVVATVALPTDAEVLSLTAAAIPGGAVGEGRFLVGLSGGRLAVLDAKRVAGGNVIALTPATTVPLMLGFDAISLSQGAAPGVVYAATRDHISGTIHGVAKISLPAALTGWSVTALDALVPTVAVAVATFDPWDFPVPGVPQADAWGTAVERVVAIPDASSCGAPPKPVRCGLLALDSVTGALVPDPVGEEPGLLPISFPAPVTGILATGRTAASLLPIVAAPGANQLPIVSGEGTVSTTGLAAISAADGLVYLVDLARWKIASDTSPLVGTNRTRVSGADVVAVTTTGSAVGLWTLGATANISALKADLAARIQVTPGFTPDDTWTLTWEGVLPGLDGRAAVLGVDGTSRWLAVQIGMVAPMVAPVSVADLFALGVGDGDRVVIAPIAPWCPTGTEVAVTGAPTGSRVTLTVPAGNCLEGVPSATRAPVVATIRAKDLVLVGQKSGYAGRATPIAASPTAADALEFAGTRLFYVNDPCTSAECVAAWGSATWITTGGFPLPKGPAVGLVAGFVTSAQAPTAVAPLRGTGITFTTASGLVPSGRRPVVKGTTLASELPTGLALVDGGAAGTGPEVYTSYTAGVLMRFSTAASTGSMAVIR